MLIGCAILVLGWRAALAGQSPPVTPGAAGPPAPAAPAELFPKQADDSFAEAIEVNVVSIDVGVRDKSGRQVTGLTRDDFTLFVDGQKVPITNLYAVGATPAAATTPGAARAVAGEASGPSRERLNLVVYVDNANLHPFDRNRILKQLRTLLQTLGSDDQVLLVVHDMGLSVRHGFRESTSTLGPALDKLDKEMAGGISKDLAQRQAMEDIDRLGCGQAEAAGSLAQAYADGVFAQVRVTYASLYHLLESLGGLDGRKVLIYVGDGVPVQVGMDVFGMIEEKCPSSSVATKLASSRQDATAPLRQVIATANANLVTFYTLEAAGLRDYVSADRHRPLVSFQLSRTIDLDRQDSLTSLARETGGRAALNGNDFTHDLEEIAADLDGGYSLGFTPPHPGDGKLHQLKIEVDRPGLRTSYRQSYRERTAAERLEGQVEAALIHGLAENPLTASLKLGTASPSEHGRVLVPVQVRVPFGKLAFVPREDGRHGRVSIFVGNMDERGGMSPIQKVQLPLRIPEADAKRVLSSHLGYDLKLLLGPGRQRIALAVRDDVARVSSTLIQEVEVDKHGAATAPPASTAPAGLR